MKTFYVKIVSILVCCLVTSGVSLAWCVILCGTYCLVHGCMDMKRVYMHVLSYLSR